MRSHFIHKAGALKNSRKIELIALEWRDIGMTKKQKKVLVRIIISAILVVAFSLIPIENQYIRLALFLVPYLVIGYDILRKAGLGIINGQVFDENFLMALATVGAIILGDYVEGTAVMLFYQVGELFQSYAVGKSRKNI